MSQVARDQDYTALKELQSCRENNKKVGLRYDDALKNSKVASLKYSSVKPIPQLCNTQFLVKETDTSTVACQVNLATTVSWRGEQFRIVTGTCSYYLSTRMICPCACTAMQRVSWDIDLIENVHPFYRIWYHPFWKEALKSLHLSDYKDSPYYSLTHLEPTATSVTHAQDTLSDITLSDTIRRHNSEIFDQIGNLGNISEDQRIHMLREHFNKLEKIAVRSVKSTKYAICSIIETTNRLGSLSLSSSNSNIQVNAIEKALHRHQKHSLKNGSALNYLKRKATTSSNDAPLNNKNCRVCRDLFKESQDIYSTHRANSSKCPHFTQVDKKSLPETKSRCEVLTPTNDKECLIADSKSNEDCFDDDKTKRGCEVLTPHNDKEPNNDKDPNNDKECVIADSIVSEYCLDDDTTGDEDSSVFLDKSNEPICPGDVILYYCPMSVAGDPRGLRTATVLSVDPNDSIPLVLGNSEGLPSTHLVR